jgi:hypothetical protein
MKTVVFVFLANHISSSVIYLIWFIEPEAQVILFETITLIESKIIISEFIFFRVCKMFSKLFSAKTEILSPAIHSLLALPDNCSIVSSPDT